LSKNFHFYTFLFREAKYQVDIRKIFISILASLQGIKASVSLRNRKINEARFISCPGKEQTFLHTHNKKRTFAPFFGGEEKRAHENVTVKI
jgi:hypothetical protein